MCRPFSFFYDEFLCHRFLKEFFMQNKEMKTEAQTKNHTPQARKQGAADAVEKEKQADTQSEFNVEQRRQEHTDNNT